MKKLSRRLEALVEHCDGEYQHIWDMCCDHGYLGMTLIKKHPSANIHFVDIVPSLTKEVSSNLERFFAQDSARLHVSCQDVVDAPLSEFAGTTLVVIAGIGGELMMSMITALREKHAHRNVDFLLCPVNETYLLRRQLSKLNLNKLEETLVEDGGRYYEVIKVSTQNGTNLSLFGDDIWQHEQSLRYSRQLVTHYEQRMRNDVEKWADCLNGYQEINASLTANKK